MSVLVDRAVGRLRILVRLVGVARLVGWVDVVGDVEVDGGSPEKEGIVFYLA